jgi:lipopolysaccharide transport system ATP-binding protein
MGMSRREIQSKFDEIVDFAGVERYIDTPVKRYSSGMYVRLAFAVAAHLEPEILIVDEVLAVGDAEFQKKCLGKMKDVSEKQGRTVLFVSHNMEAINNLCTLGVVFEKGRITSIGDVNDAFKEYFKKNTISRENQFAILNYQVDVNVVIREFTINRCEFDGFSNLEFQLKIESSIVNPFESLCILFYNSLGQRISIIDLRSIDLFSTSKKTKYISVKGQINSISMIYGDYLIGLAIGSHLYSGNVLDLIHFSINRPVLKEGQTHYPRNVLGYIDHNYFFTYE